MPPSRPYDRAAIVVVALSSAVFLWYLTLGRGDLLATRWLADMFDIQARAMLDGRLSGPPGTYGFEEFLVDGRSVTYFGTFPSVLRMPVLLVTDRFDGRLTILSMLAGYVVALTATALLIRRVRDLLVPGPWTRRTVVVAGGLLAVVALGSNLLFLGASAWVYNEAALWGAAGVLAAFAAIVAFLDEPDRLRPVVAAGLWAAVAWLSRGSVGAATSVALGLLGVAHLTGWRVVRVLAPLPDALGASSAGGRAHDRRTAGALLAAAVLPMLAFVAVNMAKFGTPFTIPFGQQRLAQVFPWRMAALDEYGGNLFSPRLILPNFVHTIRPDLVEPTRVWPFVEFTHAQPPTFGGVVFDTIEPTIGLITAAPVLVVLGLVGAMVVFRPRRAVEPTTEGVRTTAIGDVRLLRPLVLGGAVAAVIPLTIAFVAQRYLTDAVPLLVTTACAGAVVVERRWTPGATARARVGLVTLGVLALAGTYVTLAATWVFGRLEDVPDTAARAAALRVQAQMSELPGVAPVALSRLDRLPVASDLGEVAVVGACDGLYWAQKDGWATIEATPAQGHHRLSLTLDGPTPSEPTALLALGAPERHVVIGLQGARDGRVAVVVSVNGELRRGRPVGLGSGPGHEVEVWAEPRADHISVALDGREVVFNQVGPPPGGAVTVGDNPFGGPIAAAPPPGAVTALPTETPTCDRLVDQG